jgi:hypothetical protein
MAKRGFDHNEKLVCAHQVFQTDRRKVWASVLAPGWT